MKKLCYLLRTEIICTRLYLPHARILFDPQICTVKWMSKFMAPLSFAKTNFVHLWLWPIWVLSRNVTLISWMVELTSIGQHFVISADVNVWTLCLSSSANSIIFCNSRRIHDNAMIIGNNDQLFLSIWSSSKKSLSLPRDVRKHCNHLNSL